MSDATLPKGPWSESLQLRPELRALLACAQCVVGQDYLAGLLTALAACPSVDRLCETAVAHGMLGHLHKAVCEADTEVSSTLARRLRELYLALMARNLRQTSALLDTLSKLEQAGVRAIPIKGPVWAQALYGDIALRSWVDLDLLVSEGQRGVARETLLASGFTDSGRSNEKMLRAHWGNTGQIVMTILGSSLFIDLHWKITVSTAPRPLTIESVLESAGTVYLLGTQIDCPSKTAMLLMTCIEGTRDRWRTVGRLLDLAVQVKALAMVEWPGIFDAARVAGCERRAIVGVAHVCSVLGLEAPEPILAALSDDSTAQASARSLQPSGLCAEVSSGAQHRWASIRWNLATEDRRADGLRHLAARFLAPTPEDWAAFSMPGWLEWLYPVMRPARLALKWFRLVLRVPSRGRRAAR